MNSVTNRAFMAKKKMYKQPESSVEELMPQSVICTSAGEGPDAPGDTIGD